MPNRKIIGNYTRAKLEEVIRRNAVGPTVEEIDGTPSVTGVNTIKVSNGSLTDDGGGIVTLDTSAAGVVTTKRFIIAASACTDEDRTQDIEIYTKTADEGIALVRVRWGSSKYNYGGSVFYVSVGFHPTGGSLDNDSFLIQRDLAGVSAGNFAIEEYYTNWGTVWGPNSYGHRYYMHTLAYYQTAGVVWVNVDVGAGQEVGDISSGTIEVFLDIVDPGDGTTIS